MMKWQPEWVTILLTLALGVLLTVGVWADPLHRIVDSHFTDGHLAGAMVASEGFWNGDLWQLKTHLAGWPDGVMFRPLLWPIMLLTGVVGPTLALNITWALTPMVNALGGICMGRAVGLSRWGQSSLGMLLAWSTWNRVTLANGQLEQALVGIIAMVWASAIWAERGPLWRVALCPTLVCAVGLAAPNIGLSAILGLGILVVLRLAVTPSHWKRHGWILVGTFTAALLINAYHAPNYEDVPNFFQPRLHPPDNHDPYRVGIPSGWHATATQQLDRADLRSLLIPAGPQAYSQSPVQHVPFLGWTVLLWSGISIIRDRRRTWLWWVTGVVMAMLAMGAETSLFGQRFRMPYALLESLAPSMSSSGSAYRLCMAAIVALSIAAVVGIDRGRYGKQLLGVLVVMAWVETTVLPGHPLPFAVRPAVDHPQLAELQHKPGAVLDLPLTMRGSCDALTAHYFNGAVAHRRPLLHTLAAGPNYQSQTDRMLAINRAFRTSTCAQTLPGLLHDAGVGSVVLHDEPPCLPDPAIEACLREALGEGSISNGLQWWTLSP